MNDTDLVTMLGNLSQSLQSVMYLIGGFSYLAGIILFVSGLMRLKKAYGSVGQSHESPFKAVAFMLTGAALFFLPTTIHVVSSTIFGSTSVLQYAQVNKDDIFQSVGILIQTAGLIWFIRGCIMVLHANKSSGQEEGTRGFFFLCAGVMAINFSLTVGAISYIINQLLSLTFFAWKT